MIKDLTKRSLVGKDPTVTDYKSKKINAQKVSSGGWKNLVRPAWWTRSKRKRSEEKPRKTWFSTSLITGQTTDPNRQPQNCRVQFALPCAPTNMMITWLLISMCTTWDSLDVKSKPHETNQFLRNVIGILRKDVQKFNLLRRCQLREKFLELCQ